MKNILALIIICFTTIAWAQPEDARIETINGERVYVHVVQGGNTLWGIKQLYNVPVETIVRRNPGVDNGIQEGQVIYIPVPKISETKTHTVQAGETLFGISKQYGVTVDQLIQWNPEAKEGLKVGQTLKIELSGYVNDTKPTVTETETKPAVAQDKITVSFEDTVVNHTVMDGETFYSISKRYMVSTEKLQEFNQKRNTKIKPGDVLLIPIKKEKIERVKVREVPPVVTQKVDSTLLFKKKSENNVAILLPFFLDKGAGYSEQVSNMAAEFYMGAKMALDSLERIGFNSKVFVYDSKNDSVTIATILAKPEFKDMDLIIGPFYKANIQQVATWCKKNEVRMICPTNVDTKVLQNNPLVYSAVASDVTLMKGLAKYTYDNHKSDRIVLVKPTSKEDSLLYEVFRAEYMKLATNSTSKLIETTQSGFTAHLTRSTGLVLIFPSNNKTSVSKFFNELGRFAHKTSEEKTYVFGTNEWLNFEGLNSNSKSKFKLTYADAMNFNYAEPKVKEYTKRYRKIYRSDFTKMSAQGFDVTFNYCAELLMELKVGELVMNDFKNVQIAPQHGYENKNYYILSQREFEIVNVTNGIK